MRKLFSFRSSSISNNGTSNAVVSSSNNEKIHWETPWDGDITVNDSQGGTNNLSSRPGKQYTDKLDAVSPDHRSFSSPSPVIRSRSGEMNLNVSSDLKRSPSGSFNIPLQSNNYPIRCRSLTPDRQSKSKQSHRATQKTSTVEKLESSSSSRGYPDSVGNSPYSSPVPLRCRSVRLAQISGKMLDLYIDGEQQENRKPSSCGLSPVSRNDAPTESRKLVSSRRPPRVQSTGPSSPANCKGSLRSYSYREDSDTQFHHPSSDFTRDDTRPSSKHTFAKNVADKLCRVLPKKSKTRHQDFESETTTMVEDIFEDYAPITSSNGTTQTIPLFEHISFCKNSDTLHGDTGGYDLEEISGFHKQIPFVGDDWMAVEHECGDEELVRKGKEAEERILLLSEDLEQMNHQNRDMGVVALLQKFRNIADDRLRLAYEVSTHIGGRIAERSSANEAIQMSKVELDSQRRKMEKEKNELQLSLEKELDRRSNDWSSKLDKYKSEEKRLRDRVRDLAEQNVSLQREVQCLNNREVEAKTRITDLEMQLNDLTTRMEKMKTENCNLLETLSELQERSNGAEAERNCIRRNYREKEKENKDLQKAVVRLQRTCSEQEKTITGLRQGLSDEISKKTLLEKDDHLEKLQIEQLRLTGLEQMLRKELESYRLEVDSLRHENIKLLDRLQLGGNGNGYSLFNLDQELSDRVDCLQNQGLSLLDENSFICSKLLEFIKSRACQNSNSPSSGHGDPLQEAGSEIDDYSIVEFDMKVQSFRRGSENFRRSLQMISKILHDRPSIGSCESQSQYMGINSMEQLKYRLSEGDAEFELKAEILLTKVLREKLGSREMELEQLQTELAASIRGQDILKYEIRRAQDSLSCLTHKMKDLELKVVRKDEVVNQLQHDVQEHIQELTIARGILEKVSRERDLMWEEVKNYSEKNMLLNCEVISLKKKIETLDEDMLVKEGQITILRDSLRNKPFDILYSPKSMQEFAVEGSDF